MGLFSVTALWADKLQCTEGVAPEQTGWYQKKLPTFCDALAAVRKQIWDRHHFCTSGSEGQTLEIPIRWLNFLTHTLARAA